MGSPSRKPFLLRLDEGMLNELRSLAKGQGMPLTRLLHNILEDYLEDQSFFDKSQKESMSPWWMN